MIKIRNGVFETNSSSTHSIIICSKEEYEALEANKLFIKKWDDELISYDEAVKELRRYVPENVDNLSEDEIISLLDEYDIAETLDRFYDDEYLEGFSTEYKTLHGDEIVAFGKYGREG